MANKSITLMDFNEYFKICSNTFCTFKFSDGFVENY